MNRILSTLIILLMIGCSKITVLEVKNVENYYNVIYSRSELSTIHNEKFYTTLGVHNFLTEVADKDLSGWE